MLSEQGVMDTDTDGNLDNKDQPIVEIEDQANTTNSVPNQQDNDNASSVPDDQAGDNNTPQLSGQANPENLSVARNVTFTINPRINNSYLNREGRLIDRSTLSFDRVPDMYVRVANRFSSPAVFELICTRFFLESWRGQATVIPSYNDITLEHEPLPGDRSVCSTPDYDYEEKINNGNPDHN